MFEKKVPIFIYCVSPVHMGAGTAIGVIDNPIQRERHTEYPHMAGSGIKGAVRHHIYGLLYNNKDELRMLSRAFGPEPDEGDEFAGALSFADAQIVAFPVRCTSKAFVYATSPTVMARALRILAIAGVKADWSALPEVKEGSSLTTNTYQGGKLLLENFEFKCTESAMVKKAAEWLSNAAIPDDSEFKFFKNKLKQDLVMLSDEDFSYFVKNATVVEPHVRINDLTGTAEDGGLFYTENLPPESILLTLLMASRERTKDNPLDASKICEWTLRGSPETGKDSFRGIDRQMIQIGGDATTGRGQVFFKALTE